MTKRAPIASFTYNRPEHTLRSLSSLSSNPEARESELFIFCDAARTPVHQKAVEEVRHIVRSKQWCRSVHIHEQEKNLGCAQSIISGVTRVCNDHGRIIVVEDDLVLSPDFLNFMNEALDRYEHEPRVMQVSGYMYPVSLSTDKDAVFLPFTSSWGWGTWQRAWMQFDPGMTDYHALKRNRSLRRRFDLNDSYPYFEMLRAQQKGRIDSWAIRWYLSVFMKAGFTLYPVSSLVQNIGFDGSGTHCRNGTRHEHPLKGSVRVSSMPDLVSVDEEAYAQVIRYFKASQRNHPRALDLFRSFLSKGIKTCQRIFLRTH